MKRIPRQFDAFSRHEVYDRASIVLDLFCSAVAEHPVVVADQELAAEAEAVTDAIYRFYNLAAGKLMPSARGKNQKPKTQQKRDTRARSGGRTRVEGQS